MQHPLPLFMRISVLFIPLLCPIPAQSQFLKRLGNEVKSRAENKAVREAGNATESAIDKATNDAINGMKGSEKTTSDAADPEDGNNAPAHIPPQPAKANYKNYDFVPGNRILFQPDMRNEADAELPARYTVQKGTAEIQTYEGEKILHLEPDARTAVEPLMSTDHYLPGQFTLEFDLMWENDADHFRYVSDFRVGFSKRNDQNYYNGGAYAFVINGASQCSFGNSGIQNLTGALQKSLGGGNSWHHIAIYVRKNIGKAYIDAYRVAAVNNLPEGADKFYIKAGRYGIKIKNLRLAAGGDDQYNKIVTTGKFVTHGIRFDVNKSTIRPESMGTLNEIVKLLKDHSELNFEIDGHTDSDGNDEANMKLSQARADAVKAQLINMGIDGGRLTAKGFGETKPMDNNDNAEGKANNRRVEFLRK